MKLEKITLISLLLAFTFTNEVVLTNDNFFNETHIKIFHQPEFKDHFGRIDNNWLIMYHTPWCGFCKKLAPTLKQFQQKTANNVTLKFGTIDCELNKKICDLVFVHVYPTLILFTQYGKAYKFNGLKNQTTIEQFVLGGDFKNQDPIIFYTPNIFVRIYNFVSSWTLLEFIVYTITGVTFLYAGGILILPESSHKRKHEAHEHKQEAKVEGAAPATTPTAAVTGEKTGENKKRD